MTKSELRRFVKGYIDRYVSLRAGTIEGTPQYGRYLRAGIAGKMGVLEKASDPQAAIERIANDLAEQALAKVVA